MNRYLLIPFNLKKIAKINQSKPFTTKIIKKSISTLYVDYNKNIANCNLSENASFCSDEVMDNIFRLHRDKFIPKGYNVHYDCKNTKVKILDMIVVQIPGIKLNILQVLAQITSKQKYYQTNSFGNKISGTDEWISVKDMWLFEKIVEKDDIPMYLISTNFKY